MKTASSPRQQHTLIPGPSPENSSAALLRDRRGVVLARGSPPAQLLVEETAEDVSALAHGAAHPLQDQEPVGRRAGNSETDRKHPRTVGRSDGH